MIRTVARALLESFPRSPRRWVGPLGWLAVTVVLAVFVNRMHLARGASSLLPGVVGALAIPFVAYTTVRSVVGPSSFEKSARPFVAMGASRTSVVAAMVIVAIALSATTGAITTALTAYVAHGTSDPPRWRDVPMCFALGGLGAASYAAWFCAAASFGRVDLRAFALVVDVVVGEATGFGLFTPRAHLIALLGGERVLDIPKRASSVVLVAILLLGGVFAMRGSRPRTSRSADSSS